MFAGTPILEVGAAGETRIAVPLDRRAEVNARPEKGRLVYRISGGRRAGNRSPPVSPRADGPVARVELVAAEDDLDLVIDLRRPTGVKHAVVRTDEGFELRVTLAPSPAGSAENAANGDKSHPDEIPASPGPGSSQGTPTATSPTPSPSTTGPSTIPSSTSPATSASGPAPTGTSPVPPADQARTLGGHRFLTPVRFASAFAVTEVGLSIAFSHASYTGYGDRDHVPYVADVVGLAERLDVGVRVLPRVALFASVGGRFASGADGQTVLGIGADGAVEWKVGVAGVVARLEETGTQVGARLSVEGHAGGRLVSIEGLVNDSIDTKTVPPADALFGARSGVAGRFSWSVAQALGRHFSAQASLGLAGGWRYAGDARGADALHLGFGLAIGADAAPYVPIALLLEYDGDTLLRRGGPREVGPEELLSEENASALLAGLYYSGRPDLLLGVAFGAVMPVGLPGRTVETGRFELRYFF